MAINNNILNMLSEEQTPKAPTQKRAIMSSRLARELTKDNMNKLGEIQDKLLNR